MSLIVTWHPTFAFFHQPYEWGAFDCDLNRFARLIRGGLATPPTKLITNPKPKDLRAIVTGQFVAVDIETGPATPDKPWTGKDPTLAKLRTLGFGNQEWGLSFEWATASAEMKLLARDILASTRILKVFHNGPWFDIRVLKRYGMPVHFYDDTRDMRRALSPTSALKLGYLASLYNDTTPWKEGEEDDEKGIVFTDKMEDLKRYNAQDCFETARIYGGMLGEDAWNTKRVQRLYEVHTRLSHIAAKMHDTGFRVDHDERARLADVLLKLFLEREKKVLDAVGIKGFRCNANAMRALIYKRHETASIKRFSLPDPHDPIMWVKKNFKTCAVDQRALLQLLINPMTPPELKVIIELYWHAMSVWKARSTYVVSERVEQAIGPDGRLRAGWNSCGADTMRWACSSPNLMNLSEKKDDDSMSGGLPSMRAMYMASEGKKLVHADWSQQELRVRAAVAADDVLTQNLETGDVYSVDAREWFRLPKDFDVKKLKPAARKQSKIIHLASAYAAGTETVYMTGLEQDRSLTYQAVSLLHNHGFKQTYHRTVAYWFEEQDRVRKCGYSEGRILGGRRYYPREPPITEIANYPVQRTAAEIANLTIIELDERLSAISGADILTQEHDAFTFECWEDDVDQLKAIVTETMEQSRMIAGREMPFPIEIKVGGRWSEV